MPNKWLGILDPKLGGAPDDEVWGGPVLVIAAA
jgi:hypothetical protein